MRKAGGKAKRRAMKTKLHQQIDECVSGGAKGGGGKPETYLVCEDRGASLLQNPRTSSEWCAGHACRGEGRA